MNDLTERLRANESNYFMGHLFTEAADRIEELETDRDSWRHTAKVNAVSAAQAWGKVAELETALGRITAIWDGPEGKNFPHQSQAGLFMYDIARRALETDQ